MNPIHGAKGGLSRVQRLERTRRFVTLRSGIDRNGIIGGGVRPEQWGHSVFKKGEPLNRRPVASGVMVLTVWPAYRRASRERCAGSTSGVAEIPRASPRRQPPEV